MDGFTPIRIAILTSGSAPGIEPLLADPNRGAVYEITAVLGSETELEQASLLEAAKIPVILRPMRRLLADRDLSLRNLHAREEYDRETADLLKSLHVDWIILAGYHYIVTEPLLALFPDRILALHEGDLTLNDEDGRRRYTEMHSVRRAIFAGERETRSSMFFVTDRVGEGPLFLLSRPYPVAEIAADGLAWGAYDLVNEYVKVHRDWMVRSSWGEMLAHAMGFLAAGTIRVANEVAWIDGVPGPCRMGEAPRACHVLKGEVERGIPSSCPFIES
jgi:folate-dependent phosphoribosylglycinamide formyltransferase PurN